jgi:hypothetical protein
LPFACSSPHDTSGPATVLVVGIQADDIAQEVPNVHYVVSTAGQPDVEDTIPTAKLPKEVKVTAVDPSALVNVKVEGLATGGPLMISRLAKTSFVRGQTKLLRIELDARCVLALPGGNPGGPTCTEPQTCILGRCVDDAVSPQNLENYDTKWPANAPDICKPVGHGAPEAAFGTGQTDYLPVSDGQTLSLKKGPQGGHHIWTAVRMRNLKQSGSTTTVSGVQPGTGLAPPPTGVVFTFDGDEGGYCKLYGITFRLDSPSDLEFYKNFMGKPLDVTVTVKDASGDVGTGTTHINVAPTIVCPAGDTDPLCAK